MVRGVWGWQSPARLIPGGAVTGVGLDVDAPLLGVEAVGLQGSLLAQPFQLVHKLGPAVVPARK